MNILKYSRLYAKLIAPYHWHGRFDKVTMRYLSTLGR